MEEKEVWVVVLLKYFLYDCIFLEQYADMFVFTPGIKLVNVTFCSCYFLVAIMEQDET